MINNLLNEENVEINVDAKSWEEAIEKVGSILLHNNHGLEVIIKIPIKK